MICNNCGRRNIFFRKICQFCGVDISKEQREQNTRSASYRKTSIQDIKPAAQEKRGSHEKKG